MLEFIGSRIGLPLWEQVHEVVLRSSDEAARGWERYNFELECHSGLS